MMKKPTPPLSSPTICSPGPNVTSLKELASDRRSLRSRSEKRSISVSCSGVSGTRGFYCLSISHVRRALVCAVASELLDLALRAVELCRAEPIELLAALPERDRLVERDLPALEAVDDELELPLGLLEGGSGFGRGVFHSRTSSTRAARPPCARRTSTGLPGETVRAERSTSPSARTIA